METINVNASSSYKVIIENNILGKVGELSALPSANHLPLHKGGKEDTNKRFKHGLQAQQGSDG